MKPYKTILLAFIMAVACLALAKPQRGINAADGTEFTEEVESTAILYIQDGLIAHWDGLENIGYGYHDSSATIWKNLVGTGDIDIYTQNAEWHSDSLYGKPREWVSPSHNLALGTATSIPDFAYTVEVVLRTADNIKQVLYQKGVWESTTKQHVYFSSNGSIQFARATSGPTTGIAVSALPYAYHAARTCGQDNSTVSVYLNGAVYTSPVYRGTSFGGTVQRFGCGIGNREDLAFPFVGEICAMRFYNRVLSDEEIAYNFGLDAERFGL